MPYSSSTPPRKYKTFSSTFRTGSNSTHLLLFAPVEYFEEETAPMLMRMMLIGRDDSVVIFGLRFLWAEAGSRKCLFARNFRWCRKRKTSPVPIRAVATTRATKPITKSTVNGSAIKMLYCHVGSIRTSSTTRWVFRIGLLQQQSDAVEVSPGYKYTSRARSLVRRKS